MTGIIRPGAAHPHAPSSPQVLAERYGVSVEIFASWIDTGLPVDAAGLGDPFAVANWISWHRLTECPVLRRAWRGYLLIFAGFLARERRVRHIRWRRRQRICSADETSAWTWLVPRPWQGPTQTVLADDGLAGHALPAGACWRVAGSGFDARLVQGQVDLAVQPIMVAVEPAITAIVTDFAATFRYEYRHHLVDETLLGPERDHGSCLDAARTVAMRLRQRGYDAQVVSGIIAHDTFANPHFWIEVRDDQGGTFPVDPSLPAIARMLGADWRAVAQAYTGGCDARRVRLMPTHLPTALGGAIGQITLAGADAWPCLDWVCGECDDRFDDLSA